MVQGKILSGEQFDLIAWEMVSQGLHGTPKMFQLWACKQVWDIAATNYLRSKWERTLKKWCPSCRRCAETATHVLLCNEAGQVEALQQTIGFLERWLEEVDTETTLVHCLVAFAQGRGYTSMEEICRGMGERYCLMATAQDDIGWRRFMEGMVLKQLVCLYAKHQENTGVGIPTEKWASQLVI